MPHNKGKSKIGESHIPGQELGMITRSRNLVEDQGITGDSSSCLYGEGGELNGSALDGRCDRSETTEAPTVAMAQTAQPSQANTANLGDFWAISL